MAIEGSLCDDQRPLLPRQGWIWRDRRLYMPKKPHPLCDGNIRPVSDEDRPASDESTSCIGFLGVIFDHLSAKWPCRCAMWICCCPISGLNFGRWLLGGGFLEGEFFWGPLLLKKQDQKIRPKGSGPEFRRPKFVSQNSAANSGSGGANPLCRTLSLKFWSKPKSTQNRLPALEGAAQYAWPSGGEGLWLEVRSHNPRTPIASLVIGGRAQWGAVRNACSPEYNVRCSFPPP